MRLGCRPLYSIAIVYRLKLSTLQANDCPAPIPFLLFLRARPGLESSAVKKAATKTLQPTQPRILARFRPLRPVLAQFTSKRMTSTTHKPRVLLTGKIDFAHAEWQALSDIAILEVCNPTDFQILTKLESRFQRSLAIHPRPQRKV